MDSLESESRARNYPSSSIRKDMRRQIAKDSHDLARVQILIDVQNHVVIIPGTDQARH